MNLQRKLWVELILVILVATFENVSSFLFAHTKAKRSAKTLNDSLDSAGDPLFLTPLLEAGETDSARKQAKVTHPEFLDVESYAGYLTVDKIFNSNLFFWYFPAKEDSKNAPVVLFLEGGPGMTSLFSLFRQNGPFSVTDDNHLEIRATSWSNKQNMIYIDSPVGSGFSFTDFYYAYPSTQEQIGNELLIALTQFFELFPALRKNDFFVTGESYAGKFVPSVCHSIHRYNAEVKNHKKINLKGMAIANGLTDPVNQLVYGNYLYSLGFIDAEGRDRFLALEEKIRQFILRDEHAAAYSVGGQLILFTPNSLFNNLTGYITPYNILRPNSSENIDDPCPWIQRVDLRRALHVGNKTFTPVSEKVSNRLTDDVTKSQANLIAALLDHYRVLVYTGNLDMLCSYFAVQNYLGNLAWSRAEQFKTAPRRQWRSAGGELAGYVKKAGNLFEVLVRNAGHFSSIDQPQWTLELLEKFTRGLL